MPRIRSRAAWRQPSDSAAQTVAAAHPSRPSGCRHATALHAAAAHRAAATRCTACSSGATRPRPSSREAVASQQPSVAVAARLACGGAPVWPPRQLTELQGQRTGQMRRDEGSAQQQLTLQARRAQARTRRIQRQHACWGSQLRRAPQAKAAVGAVDSSQVDESALGGQARHHCASEGAGSRWA